ncbi:hypothetical protein PI124_g9218 [Phytophthora idaei]|nr:hypothetical protein PI125_g9127 [Phytophthora idaei]KAG3158423.1 hypothetical protein PI126_g7865 [Phytophthora idaei]KAG3246046.1 hypothetical protein PI124_g9218 [Phytophthora idaei]
MPGHGGAQFRTTRRARLRRAQQHGRGASRSKFHLDVRRRLNSLSDLPLQIAQLLLQLGELPTLELFQSGYAIV